MQTATQAEQTRDEAIDAFNADMSNAVTAADRAAATKALAQRIGSLSQAKRLCRDWMAQQVAAYREMDDFNYVGSRHHY